MRPYQVHLFNDETKNPPVLPSEPVFIFENKKYINFSNFDCRYLHNNEYLRETAKLNIDERGIVSTNGHLEKLEELKKAMQEFKKIESIILFPDEISALFSVFSFFGQKTTFFVDYETSPSVIAVLQYRNVEYYSHQDIEQLSELLNAHSERVIVIDGLYEWFGNIAPVNNLIKVAKDNEAVIVANEINSFGLLGRDGRGFVDLFNLYDEVNIEIGNFDRFIGGFGSYIGAKKYLINQILENTASIIESLPQFMLAVNVAGLKLIKNEKNNKAVLQKLWSNSRYFINRLKQVGFKTKSETPIIVVSFNNNDEAQEFTKRLLAEGIIVEQQKERVRLCLSVEHTRTDLDFCLDKFESLTKELGIK